MRRIVGLQAHPNAQHRFLNTWSRVAMSARMHEWVGDEDLVFAALRVLLPRYVGPAIILFRGQITGDRVGASWTRSFAIAQNFALYGSENVNPHNLGATHFPPRKNAAILRAFACQEIICSPCLLGMGEGEYIVDPAAPGYQRR
jgi:hypothetical protein